MATFKRPYTFGFCEPTFKLEARILEYRLLTDYELEDRILNIEF